MYDMYYWHQRDAGTDDTRKPAPGTVTARPRHHARHAFAASRPGSGRAARAVQVALDRRDNGGDIGAARDE